MKFANVRKKGETLLLIMSSSYVSLDLNSYTLLCTTLNRKKAKRKWKEINKIPKTRRTKRQQNKLNSLYEIMRKTAPDGVVYFNSDILQLDFTLE